MAHATRRHPLLSLAAVAFAALVAYGAPAAAVAGATLPRELRPVLFLEEEIVPDAPTDLAVSGEGPTFVSLTWSDPSGGLTDFEVERRLLDGEYEVVGTLPAGTTAWTDYGVQPGTGYEYRLRAVAAGVPSEYSEVVTAATPDAPAELAVADLGHTWVRLTWSDPSDGVGTFELERRLLDGTFEALGEFPAGTTGYTDYAVQTQTAYQYRVRSVVDGIPAAYSAMVTITTLPPLPLSPPGALVAEVLSPTSVSLRWEDRSEEEIQMQVFRGVDGGMPVLVMSLPADSVEWIDLDASADRAYSYTVRGVGVAGPSIPSAAAQAVTPASLSVQVLSGKRVDSAKASKDSIDLTLVVAALPGGALPDMVAAGFSLAEDGGPALVTIPAGDSGWKERRGVFTWKSPKGSLARATVTYDPAKGTLRFKATRMQLDAVDAAAVKVSFRCGVDAGSETEAWTAKRPGTLVRQAPVGGP